MSVRVKEVIKFINKLMKEVGSNTNYEVHANYTSHDKKVDGVGEFKFYYEDCATMFGGTTHSVYHKGELVLSVYDGKIQTYKEGNWVKDIDRMIEKSDRVIANYKKRHPELSEFKKKDKTSMEKENESSRKFYSDALKYKMEHPDQFPLWFM